MRKWRNKNYDRSEGEHSESRHTNNTGSPQPIETTEDRKYDNWQKASNRLSKLRLDRRAAIQIDKSEKYNRQAKDEPAEINEAR